ncbi:MAG: tetratricopeptide repeat protein [Perlabentimonas sp.]
MSDKLELGMQALYSGNLEEAERLLSQAIMNNPLNAEAYFHRGKARWQSNALPAAIKDFQKTLEINPLHNQAKVSMEMVKQVLNFRDPNLNKP